MDFYERDEITIPQEVWDSLINKSSRKTRKQQEFIEGIKRIILSGNRVFNEKGRILGYNPTQDRFYDMLGTPEPDNKNEYLFISRDIDKQIWKMVFFVFTFLLIKTACIYVLRTLDPERYEKIAKVFPHYRPGLCF